MLSSLSLLRAFLFMLLILMYCVKPILLLYAICVAYPFGAHLALMFRRCAVSTRFQHSTVFTASRFSHVVGDSLSILAASADFAARISRGMMGPGPQVPQAQVAVVQPEGRRSGADGQSREPVWVSTLGLPDLQVPWEQPFASRQGRSYHSDNLREFESH